MSDRIAQRHIRHFGARYHRNGVSGEGFFCCTFQWLEGGKLRPMTAVVFSTPGQIAILDQTIDLRTVNNRWRGDDFEPAIREALAAMERAQPEKLYSHEEA